MTDPTPAPTSYVAQPPKPVFSIGGLLGDIWMVIVGIMRTLKDTVAHFDHGPRAFRMPPEADAVEPDVLERCEKLYERSEATRKGHEDKARGVFAIVSFLMPLVSAGLVYVFAHPNESGWPREVAVSSLIASAAFLVLAFIWIARVIGVRAHMAPGVASVIKDDAFVDHDSGRYAQNLVYCASYNEGMNALYAQFVRNAHTLTIAGVLLALTSAMPLGVLVAHVAAVEQKAAASVAHGGLVLPPAAPAVSVADLAELRTRVAALENAKALSPVLPPVQQAVPGRSHTHQSRPFSDLLQAPTKL